MNDPLHREIMKTLKHCKTTYGRTLEEAVKQAVKLRKHLINENLMPEHDEEDVHDANEIYWTSFAFVVIIVAIYMTLEHNYKLISIYDISL